MTWFSLDQNVRNGFLVEFLGSPATTFTGPVRLARRLGLPIVPAFVHQTGPAAYELECKPPISLPRSTPTDDELLVDMRRLMAILEEEILRFPESWLWAHRRWRHGDRLAAPAP
jgi:KDO2-lipid IV(A) lauroyltransferase